MSYQEEEKVRLRRQRSRQAITLAMQGRWREAVAANKEIVESFPSDVDAFNRLGRAYIELGEYELAKGAYGQASALDPYNVIAQKNLDRLAYLEETGAGEDTDSDDKVEPQHFIEETGKAGVVELLDLAPRNVLARMVAGDKVYLRVEGSDLLVENGRGENLGRVEARHAQRLIRLMAGGNNYTAAIISSREDRVAVIIREIYQDPSQAGQLSFPSKAVEGLPPYISDKLLRRGVGYEEILSEEAADFGDAAAENMD